MERKNWQYCLTALVILFLCYSCAQFATPQGGPKDEQPPEIVEALSEPNFQTFFRKKRFELEFNEWIDISNPAKEVAVSPPTSYPIKVTARGKRLRVEFAEEEVLRDSATYQINFGDAVRDFTANNIYKNLVFVFSTGREIDSLSVAGTITDALSGDPVNDVVVCLYDKLKDSIISQEKPFYFTKTDKSGRYKLSNIRSDTFLIFALKDENVNYYYDLSSEKLGFYSSPLILKDSSLINVDLAIFDEEDPPRLVEYKQNEKGLIRLMFKPMPDSLVFREENGKDIYFFTEPVKDSVYLWHNDMNSDSTRFIVQFDGRSDTITNKKARKSARSIKLKLDNAIKNSISFHKGDTLYIKFNKPLDSVDISRISIRDSSRQLQARAVFVKDKRLGLYLDSIRHNYSYMLGIDSSALRDIFGTENKDSLSLILKTFNPENFGDIALNFINEADTVYLWELRQGNNLIGSGSVNETTRLEFNKMSTGSYTLKLIEDINSDGKWTSGKAVIKRHPERIKEITLEELKPGWDLELDIEIKQIFYGTAGEQSN